MRTALVTLALVALAAGCGWRKEHLTPTWGRSSEAAFEAQTQNRTRPPRPAVTGLDPQEAAILVEAYRTRLAPEGTKVDEPRMIFVAPAARDGRAQELAPSVPRE